DGIQQYNFGTNILGAPEYMGNFTFSSVIRPYFIKVFKEGNNYFAGVANENRAFSIINFGDLSGTPAPFELPNATLPRIIGFDVAKHESINIIQGSIWCTDNFAQLQFHNQS